MPLDEKAPVWNYAGNIYKKQVPCTRFIDELEAVDVKLVSSPNKDELYKLMKNVAFVSFGKDWDEFIKFVEDNPTYEVYSINFENMIIEY